MNERIIELKKQIKEQEKENVRLFGIFQYKMYKEEMQIFIEQWRDGSKKIKELMRELQELELFIKKSSNTMSQSKKFVNSYGESTKREITCSTYERQQKRLSKQILSYMS